MAAKTYNAKDVTMILGGIPITGLADGTFVTVEQREPSFSLQMGTDGEGTRSASNNRSATITFSTMQSSATNSLLSALHAADVSTGAGVVPLLITDLSGTPPSTYTAESAWITAMPTAEFAREATAREWVIETDKLIQLTAGN